MNNSDKKLTKHFITLATALTGGFLFQWIGLPIPWLLGPMIMTLLGSIFLKNNYAWNKGIRDVGMLLVGYTIGLSLTGAALQAIAYQLPTMLLMTALLLLMCGLFALIVSRLSGIGFLTLLMGSIPGGLTQTLILAEETKGIDLTIVTVYQVIRVMVIVTVVPLLIFSPLYGYTHTDIFADTASGAAATADFLRPSEFSWMLILFILAACAGAFLAHRIKLPTAFILGPVLGVMLLQLLWQPGPALPELLLDAAQLMIGANVGLMLKPSAIQHKMRTIGLAMLSSVLLVIGSVGLSQLLKWLQSLSPATALLSMAPGGSDQISILAHEINADLSIVAGYQLFRTFFIMLAVPPLFRVLLKYYNRRSARLSHEDKK
ncbi:AbrB family transcriptional regulator [Paenibacillaceae bacterium]|nr:AbrB family transcriptional regulator [Paenibacillaceae bacterium]